VAFRVDAQHQDPGATGLRAQGSDQVDHPHTGHRDVEQQHIDGTGSAGLERAGTVLGLTHQGHVAVLGDETLESLPNHRVVVGNDELDGHW
jgi:hypothetical protein